MNIIIFDTETTGLPQRGMSLEDQPHVCQFASMTVEYDSGSGTFKEIDSINHLIKPPISIPAETSAIHGIDDAKVADAPSFSGVVDEITEAFLSSDLAVAHNLAFDRDLLVFELQRLNRDVNFLSEQLLDTMTSTKDFCKLPGRYGNYKLPRLEELFSILFSEKFDGAHDAMNDVRACARCAEEIISRGMFVPEEPIVEESTQASLF